MPVGLDEKLPVNPASGDVPHVEGGYRGAEAAAASRAIPMGVTAGSGPFVACSRGKPASAGVWTTAVAPYGPAYSQVGGANPRPPDCEPGWGCPRGHLYE
jgi:hypothetical protein